MSDVDPDRPHTVETVAQDIVRRALNLLLHPAETWDAIEAEPDTIERLFRYWVMPLAAIPAIAGALGRISFGSYRIFGADKRGARLSGPHGELSYPAGRRINRRRRPGC